MKPKIKKALKFYFWVMIGIPVSVIMCPVFVFCFYIAMMGEFKEDLEYEIELEKSQNKKGRKNMNDNKTESGSRDFSIISCNAFDCIHNTGSGCRQKTVTLEMNGNCQNYTKKNIKIEKAEK